MGGKKSFSDEKGQLAATRKKGLEDRGKKLVASKKGT